MNILLSKLKSLKYNCKIKKGTNPLKTSKLRTIIAKILFPVRKTLVAPIFPDPILRISPKPDTFVKINANGNDPIR